MNAQLIRERWRESAKPFVFRWSDGTRVAVVHPDFMMMIPGRIMVSNKTGRLTRIDPLHIVAIEGVSPRRSKTNDKRRPGFFMFNVKTVRDRLHQAPFRPFNFRLPEGREICVEHPDFVSLGGRAVVVTSNDDTVPPNNSLHVVSLDNVSAKNETANPPDN